MKYLTVFLRKITLFYLPRIKTKACTKKKEKRKRARSK
jgi:hypothetical protein